MEAVALGALQYLVKPFAVAELRRIVERRLASVELHASRKRRSRSSARGARRVGSSGTRGDLLPGRRNAVDGVPAGRSRGDRSLFGYEALVRSPVEALSTPAAMLDAAERLGRLPELGQKIRAASAAPFGDAPEDAILFVNLHAADLNDPTLTSPAAPLCKMAHRVVLEITERASLDQVNDPRGRIAELRSMGFRIAIDDLGAGYAGLTSFATIEPQFVKLDGSLVRGVDRHPTKRRLIRSMTALCKDLSIVTVAEASRPSRSAKPSSSSAATSCKATSWRDRTDPSRVSTGTDRPGRVMGPSWQKGAREAGRTSLRILAALVLASSLGCAAGRPTPRERATSLAREHREADAIQILREHLACHDDDVASRRLLIRVLALTGDLGGTPASRRTCTSRQAMPGVCSAGLNRTVLPVTSAAVTIPQGMARGSSMAR